MPTIELKRTPGKIRKRRWRTAGRDWQTYRIRLGRYWWLLYGRAGFGITCWACCTPSGDLYTWDDADWIGDVEMVKKRKAATEVPAAAHLAAMESTILGKHHSLVAHCAATQYDDGSSRKPGWIVLKTLGSAWVVEVKDPDTCSRLSVVQQTLDDALTLASILLESDEAPWEIDPWMKAQKGKKS